MTNGARSCRIVVRYPGPGWEGDMAEHTFDPECPICIAERNAIQAAVDTMNEPGKLREATSAREMLRACIDPDCGQTEGHGPDCAQKEDATCSER